MGRAILIVVLLVSTIYAGIIVQVQKEMYKLPEVIVQNFITKECENVSDYALRAAVRLGTEDYILTSGQYRKVVDFNNNIIRNYNTAGTLLDTLVVNFSNAYKQGNSTVNKIVYQRLQPNSSFIEATTFITGSLQGVNLDYQAQIAYDYPDLNIDGPLVLYNEYNAQTHAPNQLPDQSTHPSGIPMEGYVVAVGTNFSNVVMYSSQGLDRYFGGGGGTHKCIQFGAARVNGQDHIGGWVQTPNPTNANYTTLLDRLKNYNTFTVAIYAKPEKVKNNAANSTNTGSGGVNVGGNCGTLIWFASNPNNSKWGEIGYSRPAAAIWYDNYQSATETVTMHYQVTIDDGTASGTSMQITRAGCPIFTNLSSNQSQWHMYSMTFNNGVLTAYYDTQVVGTITAPGGYTSIKPSDYGFTLGMRDIRADSPSGLCPTQYKHPGTNYMFFNGLMDQITVWDRSLTPEQIDNWYNNYVDKTVKLYIRD